jgi:hypothetical protein
MNDAQCTDAKKPRCDTQTNACVGCEGASDCSARFPITPYCDGEIKACVACSPTGAELCPVGNYCDKQVYECVPGMPKRRNCEPCRGDEECADSASISACIESQADSGRFCFAATIAATPLCEQGYKAASAPGRPNLMYCMPPSSASCPAISNALNGKQCSNAGDCGRNGQCPMPTNICTLQCSSDPDCPASYVCDQAIDFCKRP